MLLGGGDVISEGHSEGHFCPWTWGGDLCSTFFGTHISNGDFSGGFRGGIILGDCNHRLVGWFGGGSKLECPIMRDTQILLYHTTTPCNTT